MQMIAGTRLRLTILSAIILLFATILLVRLGTTGKSDAYLAASSQDTRSEQTQRSIKVFAQPRPGAPMQETNMRVQQTPSDLPIVSATKASLKDDDLVLGVVADGQAVAFPIRYLAMFEVTNSRVGTTLVAPTW